MKGKSILLALSGSEQSRSATEVCWRLARRLGTAITAHHVIDSHSAWEFLGHENPGFLKSSVYLEAYQQLVTELFSLGEGLAQSYSEQAKALGIDDVCIIDEGNPINEICSRASNHSLVVIGHKKNRSRRDPRSQFQRHSIAEALSHDCPRPLLVVQDECKEWTSMSIMISMDHINRVFINSCLDMAEALNLRPNLIRLTGGSHEESDEDFVKDMRAANERLKDVPITMAPAKHNLDINVMQWYAPPGEGFDQDIWNNTLIVIPTRMTGAERVTVVDSSPSLFVRYLELPSIMLWPEEFVFSKNQSQTKVKELSAIG